MPITIPQKHQIKLIEKLATIIDLLNDTDGLFLAEARRLRNNIFLASRPVSGLWWEGAYGLPFADRPAALTKRVKARFAPDKSAEGRW
jgi:hypothetical protein